MRRLFVSPLRLILVAFVMITMWAGCEEYRSNGSKEVKEESTQMDSAGSSGKAGSSVKDTVKLRMSFFAGTQEAVDETNQMANLFMAKHPDIKIDTEFTNYESYFKRLSVQAASNNLPDIMRQDYAFIAQFARRGLLLDLTPYIESDIIKLKDVASSNLEGGIVDGAMTGINIGNNAVALIYDPELFREAGVAEPTETWTWGDYEHAVVQIYEKTGIFGDTHQGLNFYIFLRQHGKSMYNEDGTGLGYEDDTLFIDFFNLQMRLQKAGALSPIEEEVEAKRTEETVFAKNKTAMVSYWSNNLDFLERVKDKSLRLAMLPGSGEGGGMFMKPSQFLSVSKSSKYPKEAALFIDFWVNDIDANKMLKDSFGSPYSEQVIKALEPQMTDAQKKVSAYLKMVQRNASPIDPPEPNRAADVMKALLNITLDIYMERIDVADAAEKFRKTANSILAKNKS